MTSLSQVSSAHADAHVALPAAVAVHFVHEFSLLHDEVENRGGFDGPEGS